MMHSWDLYQLINQKLDTQLPWNVESPLADYIGTAYEIGYELGHKDERADLDYDSLHKDYTEAVDAVRWLKIAFERSLAGKSVMNADEVIAHAETILNKV